MRRTGWLACALLALPLLGGWEMFRSPDPRVQRGNDAFAQGRYDDAIGAYEEARGALPQEPGVDYDLGAALYQKGLHASDAERDGVLERAGEAFQGAARATDPKLAAQAQNGLGSALFRRGKFAQAAQELKKGLRLDPENREIRHNLELALRRKKEEQQKEKEKQQQKKQQDQQDKDKQEQEKKKPGADGQPGDPQPQGEGEPPKPDDQGKDPQAPPKPDEQGKDPQPGEPKDPAQPDPAKQDPKDGKDGKPEDGKDGKPEDGKDGKPGQGAQEGKAEPRREVDRKLDALERRSRAAQLRRLRARAAQGQGGRLARPDQDW